MTIEYMDCKICKNLSKQLFKAKMLDKYDASYFYCENCGFLQTEKPYWIKESYKESINASDTGILSRNLYLSKIISSIISCLFDKNGLFVDYGGGYGILTRLMRDIGFNFYSFDPYTKNIISKNFEYQEKMKKAELVTVIECFEHFSDPLHNIEKIISISKNILFSTVILPAPIPHPKKWWYYGLEHGQHISFYSIDTLKFIAKQNNLNLLTSGNIHLFTEKNIRPTLYSAIVKYHRLRLLFDKIINKRRKSLTFSDMSLVVKKNMK